MIYNQGIGVNVKLLIFTTCYWLLFGGLPWNCQRFSLNNSLFYWGLIVVSVAFHENIGVLTNVTGSIVPISNSVWSLCQINVLYESRPFKLTCELLILTLLGASHGWMTNWQLFGFCTSFHLAH